MAEVTIYQCKTLFFIKSGGCFHAAIAFLRLGVLWVNIRAAIA